MNANEPGFRALVRLERNGARPDRGYIEQPSERAQPPSEEAPSERKRRKVITDDAVKMAAAERVLIGGAKRAEVAESLDVSPSAIGLWINEYRERAAAGTLPQSSARSTLAPTVTQPPPRLEVRFDNVRFEGLEEYIEALVDARVEARVSAAVKAELRKRLAGD